MTTLAAISWGLCFAMFVCVINLCVISTIRGRSEEKDD